MKNEFSKTPGVYVIVNKATDKVFVKASLNVVKSVKKDLTQLHNGDFENEYVQADWNEFGEDVFEVHQLKECGMGKLEYYLGYFTAKFDADCFENGYNDNL